VTVARSRSIHGPYETHPQNPILSSRGRPVDGKHCILGRETALQRIKWRADHWPELESGGRLPATEISIEASPFAQDTPARRWNGRFDGAKLDIHFQSLRRPISEDWLSLAARPGWLRLYGGEPTCSLFKQSLIARRIQSLKTKVETCVEFSPADFQQTAGLIAYYDTRNHYCLSISHDEAIGRCLNIVFAVAEGLALEDGGPAVKGGELLEHCISLPESGPVYLSLEIGESALTFRYSLCGKEWAGIGPELDARILSDDYHALGFTGAFAGLYVQDIAGTRRPADFAYFHLSES